MNYEVIKEVGKSLIKLWTTGVPVEDEAKQQLLNTATMPFIHSHIAVMPDVHVGIGATIGSVVPTIGAVIPAAVGVDIGCGMMAYRTTLTASALPDDLSQIRKDIEDAIPVGFATYTDPPQFNTFCWDELRSGYDAILDKYPKIKQKNTDPIRQLGTLGGGNHFIELCLDTEDFLWIMLHSGSRGIGNRIGTHFIELAKKDMERHFINLPDKNLAYLSEGTEHFNDYVQAVEWAQRYASNNRLAIMARVIDTLREGLPEFNLIDSCVNCHHNYISREYHYGKSCIVTRKGAVSAKEGEWGIIPGSMGAKSFIVQGKGNPDSFHSCSHGAGRVMSRTAAKLQFNVDDLTEATAGVECRKDSGVIDEIPQAYKSIDAVMAAQSDLVEIKYQLKQILCVKG